MSQDVTDRLEWLPACEHPGCAGMTPCVRPVRGLHACSSRVGSDLCRERAAKGADRSSDAEEDLSVAEFRSAVTKVCDKGLAYRGSQGQDSVAPALCGTNPELLTRGWKCGRLGAGHEADSNQYLSAFFADWAQ